MDSTGILFSLRNIITLIISPLVIHNLINFGTLNLSDHKRLIGQLIYWPQPIKLIDRALAAPNEGAVAPPKLLPATLVASKSYWICLMW